jgi:hypothetical protein
MEPNEIVEPEIVEESRELARPSVPTNVNELAALDEGRGVRIIEQRAQILETLRVAALKLIMPSDVTLFKSPDGIVTGFIGDSGCDRIKKLFGIRIEHLSAMERIEEPETGLFAYRITGDGVCGITGEAVFDMEGIRYSNEPYAQQKTEGLQRIVAVQKAARANLDGGITRELAGLKSIPSQEFERAWDGSWKKLEMCAKGRGYGSGAERSGAQVQQSSEIDVKYQPKCEVCHEPMKFVPAGKAQSGKPYSAFWGCAKDRTHKPTIPHEQALKEAGRMKAEEAARQPGDEQ